MEAHARILWTIGHSTRPWADFVALLQGTPACSTPSCSAPSSSAPSSSAPIACLADVRRFAGSRRNPQYSPADMGPALAAAGIDYVPMPELGGRRATAPDSRNGAWRVDAFRGYADYMATPEFALARERLMARASAQRTAVMCAEAVWWRCHRRLIADDFVARGWTVLHIMGPGKVQPHELNADARMEDGVLRYPAPDDARQALL